MNRRVFSDVLKPFFPAVSIAVLCLAGCHKAEPPQTVLAQVDQSRLTLNDLRETFPPELEKVLPREQYLNFIQRWIDDEVVYQQALKHGIDQDPKVKSRLQALRRKVLIEEFLARQNTNEDYEPDEEAISHYYESHKDAFRRTAPEFRYAHIRMASLKEAQTVRTQIKGDNFMALGVRYSLDSARGEISAIPFRKASQIPLCILAALDEAKPGFVSPPLTCADGIYLVKLLDREEAGSPIPYTEAKESIIAQLVMEHKDEMRAAKIRQFKEGAAISLNLDQIPGREATPDTVEPEVVAAPPPNVPPLPPKHKRNPPRRHAVARIPAHAPDAATPAAESPAPDVDPAQKPAVTDPPPASNPPTPSPSGTDHAPNAAPDP